MQYLINLADQGIVHDVPDLRDRVQQLLNLIPSGKSLSSLPLFTVSGYYTLVNETNNGLQVNNQFSSNINLFFLPNFVFIYLVCVPSSAVVATDWMLAGMGASDQLWRNPIVVLAIHILSMFFFFFRHRNSRKYQECLSSLFRKLLKDLISVTRCHVFHSLFHSSSL